MGCQPDGSNSTTLVRAGLISHAKAPLGIVGGRLEPRGAYGRLSRWGAASPSPGWVASAGIVQAGIVRVLRKFTWEWRVGYFVRVVRVTVAGELHD